MVAPNASNPRRSVEGLKKALASGKYERADREAAKLLATSASDAALWVIRGEAALAMGNPQLALAHIGQARELEPRNEKAAILQADCMSALNDTDAAVESLVAFLDDANSWNVRRNLAHKLMSMRRYSDALGLLQSGLRGEGANAQMLDLLGQCLQNLNLIGEAISAFELGIKLDPKYPWNFLNRAHLAHVHERVDPRMIYLQALQAVPDHPIAKVQFLWASLARCDWDAFDKLAPNPMSLTQLAEQKGTASPWFFLPFMDDPAASLKLQKQRQKARLGRLGLKRPRRVAASNNAKEPRIRVGYYSNDFYDHATLRLFSGVLRHHDRNRFEIHCLNFGQSDAFSQESMCHFDQVHNVRAIPDTEVTALARSQKLDIAVDLKGDTAGSRADLFLLGQAPTQINYLGYPGTMGSDAYDYIIGDAVLIPPDLEKYYAEKVVRLPTCYLPNDDRRRAGLPPTRTELGLPEDGVVLACLNDPYKISRDVFDLWMRALIKAPDSVLWLLGSNADATRSLCSFAAAAGVQADRIIFAEKCAHQDHITRLAQADLYLDTFNCNAHTLAAEAICAASVPLLTRAGRQFAARVGASFATAAGTPELVAKDSAEYLAKLVALASNKEELLRLRGVIASNRSELPLFSSHSYTRFLEEAFSTATDRVRKGLAAKSFEVSGNNEDPL